MAVPNPGAFVPFAFREQPQLHRVFQQFEHELRRGGVRHAELLPVHAVIGL